ncbi:hypothetical protein BDP55DRAFT_751340 [Colletotrichum godetiae]|uniref:Uncharacterized protein n=1 Tax=Colletotrichum godetiae TaxID=1209918 RepID=A0AAJ0AYW6_9PEZI|nr:uncharacterized protein BDP55DRAFT_751340 [Colletotrichum godetiae]KAK1691561.1 hypothetical protein BDP55DRAFT_751340 [Colletotrichum godetiae]
MAQEAQHYLPRVPASPNHAFLFLSTYLPYTNASDFVLFNLYENIPTKSMNGEKAHPAKLPNVASNSRSSIEANTKNDQERFDGTLPPHRKNRKLLMRPGTKSKLNKPDSANFHWPPPKDPRRSLPSSHHGEVFLSFAGRIDCRGAVKDLEGSIYPARGGPRELSVKPERGRYLAFQAAVGHSTANIHAFAGALATPRPQLKLPVPSPSTTTVATVAPVPPVLPASATASADQFRLGMMERLLAFLQNEMKAITDGDRMRMSEDFFLNEIHIRWER